MRALPPRLPERPIFYPVTTAAYANKIARDWNCPPAARATSRFEVGREYLDRYAVQTAGGRTHQEYRIPAEELPAFNAAIVGEIEVTASFP